MDSDSTSGKVRTRVLVVIVVIELLLLVPWLIFAALGAMGFDSGFNWGVVFVLAPLWAYPFLILICGLVAFAMNQEGRGTAAVITVLLPPIISAVGPFVGLLGISVQDYLAYKPEFDKLCKNARVVVFEVVAPARSIAIVPAISGNPIPKRLLLAPETPLQFVEAESHDLQGKVSLIRITSVRDKTDTSTDPLAQRRTFVESPIKDFSAEYLVIPSTIKLPDKLFMRIYGQKIEVLRASDKKPISYAEYYSMGDVRCPEGVGGADFISEFISKSLNIPKRL